jgi:hypothetical protein
VMVLLLLIALCMQVVAALLSVPFFSFVYLSLVSRKVGFLSSVPIRYTYSLFYSLITRSFSTAPYLDIC